MRGPMSEDPEFRTVSMPDNYPDTTTSPVRILPVRLGGRTIGYLWAAVTDDAAGFVERPDAGHVGLNARIGWVQRIRWAKANQVRPLQVLRQWAGKPEHAKAGFVPDVAAQEAPSLAALRTYAQEPEAQ
ncbi:hypothetical protein C7C45_06560 [Micromonospora arborensis]|uniref:Uncharacterized protein n=1 Tax=Micromonospora arborensis TaxID=2116518 RepID=A0A318NP51_9ACTN|nr:hypothetical protein [Micromonospora arborensis]PYC73341.1 hypothetical protein C7C45_06560 [Micromonospora arborensis]